VQRFEFVHVQRDGDSGPVAPGEKPLAAQLRAIADSRERQRRLAKGHRGELALDPAISSGFRLLRRMAKQALDRRNAGRGVTELAALRERRVEHQPVGIGHVGSWGGRRSGRRRGTRGAFAHIPAETLHTFSNVGSTPARWIGIFSPASGLDMLEELAPAFANPGPPDLDVMDRVFGKYHVEVVGEPPPG